jgi:hypothetical protein
MRRNPSESARKLAMSLEFQVSPTTIRRILKKKGFAHKRIKPKKTLSEIHKEKRREYAVSHLTWTPADWARVVFTDEKCWNLSGNDGYISIWTESEENPLKNGGNKPKRRTHGVGCHLQIWRVASGLHGGRDNC